MTPEQQIVYLASWRHASLCGEQKIRGPRRPPSHSWTECQKMRRFHWAMDATASIAASKAHAIGATAATLDASRQIGAALGQRDALCGRTRGEAGGIEFEPCSQSADHAADGKVCVFLARAPKSGSRRQGGAGE